VPSHHLSDFRVFGCPAYVLEKNLADDNGIPKWKARAYRGVYIGHSDQHSSSIAMIWNPTTKLVSAQYHIVFDEGFQTVSSLGSTLDHDAVQAAFGTLLKSTEWLHSDKYAATNPTETQHYYFDNDWVLVSHQGDPPQEQASPHPVIILLLQTALPKINIGMFQLYHHPPLPRELILTL